MIIKNIFVVSLLICLTFLATTIFADLPPDPGTGGPGTGDIPVGGSSLGGGLIMLLALGAVYGSKKVIEAKKEETK